MSHGYTKRLRAARHAFTLVELLTVIVIIGILASMLVGAVIAVRIRARVASIATEISNLDTAIHSYQEKYGELPPDFSGANSTDSTTQARARTLVVQHLAKAFPRYVPGAIRGSKGATYAKDDSTFNKFLNDLGYFSGLNSSGKSIAALATDGHYLDQASSLVFWLGGIVQKDANNPQDSTKARLIGFSANPLNPFDPNASRLPKLFDFNEARLDAYPYGSTGAGAEGYVLSYHPDGTQARNAAPTIMPPYVYFRAQSNTYFPTIQQWWPYFPSAKNLGAGFSDKNGLTEPDDSGKSVYTAVRPYCNSKQSDFSKSPQVISYFNASTFQIICAGADGLYGIINDGNGPLWPSGANLGGSSGHFDNQTNFTARGTLEDTK